jgi:hypothetical protein
MAQLIRLDSITPESLHKAMAEHEGLERAHLKLAAEYLIHHQIKETFAVGNVISSRIQLPVKGQTITVPMGVLVWQGTISTGAYSGRKYQVEVSNLHRGHLSQQYTDSPKWIEEDPANISWAGRGGLYNHMSIRNWIEMRGQIIDK